MTEQQVDQNEVEELDLHDQGHTEAPASIRDTLAAALEETKTKNSAPEKSEKKPIEKKAKTNEGEEQPSPKEAVKVNAETNKAVSEPEIKLPNTLSRTLAESWKTLPPAIQKEISKREEDFHRELTKHDEERLFGRQIKDLASPYLPLIKAEGGDLNKAFGSFLNTAYVLRTKSPQEKGALLLQLAREFGADLQGALQPQANGDPRFNQLMQKMHTLESELQKEREAKTQQENMSLKSQIEAFAADPKNIHFETVKADMAALLKGGVAKDLQDAYDRAVYANPQTRSTLLQQQTVESEEKRLAEKKAKAEQAKRAGSSVKGAPGITAAKNGKITQPNLRSELMAAFAAHREG